MTTLAQDMKFGARANLQVARDAEVIVLTSSSVFFGTAYPAVRIPSNVSYSSEHADQSEGATRGGMSEANLKIILPLCLPDLRL